MSEYFEVSAIKDVRAACPVCDPVANIYGPVHDGSGPSLPSCPAFKVRGLGGRSVPLLRGLSQRRRTDLRCPGGAGPLESLASPSRPSHLASGLAPGQGSGLRLWQLSRVLAVPVYPPCTHSGILPSLGYCSGPQGPS